MNAASPSEQGSVCLAQWGHWESCIHACQLSTLSGVVFALPVSTQRCVGEGGLLLPRLLYQLLRRSRAEASAPTACLKSTLGCGWKAVCAVCCQLPFAVAGKDGEGGPAEEWDARLQSCQPGSLFCRSEQWGRFRGLRCGLKTPFCEGEPMSTVLLK